MAAKTPAKPAARKPAAKKRAPEPKVQVVKEIVKQLTPTELVTILADAPIPVMDKQEVIRAFVRAGIVHARYESAMVGHIADPVVPLNL